MSSVASEGRTEGGKDQPSAPSNQWVTGIKELELDMGFFFRCSS